jgi:hypothetical protein
VTLNMVTKRGTNEWRGSGRFITTTTPGRATLDFARATSPRRAAWNNNRRRRPPFRQGNRHRRHRDYGAELGGPIVATGCGSGPTTASRTSHLLTIPTSTDYTELDTYGAKLNAQLTSNNSLVGFYNYGDKIKIGRNAGPTRPQPTTWNQTGPTDIYKLEDTHIFGSNFYLTGMVSYVGGGFQLTPQGGLDGNPNSVTSDARHRASGRTTSCTTRPTVRRSRRSSTAATSSTPATSTTSSSSAPATARSRSSPSRPGRASRSCRHRRHLWLGTQRP